MAHARTLFANAEDFLFGLIEDLRDLLALRVESLGGDFIADRHQFAQNRTLAHDFRIAADVAGTGHVLGQGIEVSQATDLLGFAHPLQMLENGDHIGRPAGVDQSRQRGKNLAVLVAVKIAVLEHVANPVPG